MCLALALAHAFMWMWVVIERLGFDSRIEGARRGWGGSSILYSRSTLFNGFGTQTRRILSLIPSFGFDPRNNAYKSNDHHIIPLHVTIMRTNGP